MVAPVLDAAPRPTDPAREARQVPAGRRRGARVAAATLLVLACVFSGLCLLLVGSAGYDDVQINSREGAAVADVLSVGYNRTAVRFVTPDGTVVIPPTGVLYPTGLKAGEEVRVQYDTANPELVRVAGRGFTLSFLPVGTSLAVCWAIAGPAAWLLRRYAAGRRISVRRSTS
jgi:hypothetical protein